MIDSCMLTIAFGVSSPAEIVMVERKGWCHPDTMADQLAEGLSRVYSRYTLKRFGVVLHHNFDKLCLLGGSSDVHYGAGRMLSPVRVLVNGRAARSFGDDVIPVDGLVRDFVKEFFAARLPELEDHVRVELNVTSNPSPGAVATGDGVPERSVWFAPRSVDDPREQRSLLANDTALGTGWAPEHPVEAFVRDLVDMLSNPGSYRSTRPWLGADVKVMAYADTDEVDLVA
ncbi:MAG: methionine adenosyltransferase, partial [Pseudonocardiaceae bacterium]